MICVTFFSPAPRYRYKCAKEMWASKMRRQDVIPWQIWEESFNGIEITATKSNVWSVFGYWNMTILHWTHTHTHMKFQSKPVFGWPPTIIFGTVVTSRSHQNSLRHHFYFMSIQFYAFFRIYRHMLFIDTGTATTIATITRRRRRKKYYNTTERMCACVFCCCCCFYFSFEEARFQTIPCDL